MTDTIEERIGKTEQSIITTRCKKIRTHSSGCSSPLEQLTDRKKQKQNNILWINEIERKRERAAEGMIVILIYRLSLVMILLQCEEIMMISFFFFYIW